jgi:hypothetical protein
MLATTPLHPTIVDAAEAISVPRQQVASSFVLHAPLELMARVGLLPYVDAAAQDEAVARIGRLADTYTASGPAVDAPQARQYESFADATTALTAAIEASDLDDVDATMTWLTEHARTDQLRHLLGEAVVDSLAAAAHTPIGLYLLPIMGDGRLPASLLRAPVRELARAPHWRLDWFRTAAPNTGDEPVHRDLESALRLVPQLGRPGSDFIYPLMSQAEQSGVAPNFIAPLLGTDIDDARHALLRAAAWSMLHDDPEQAPYGWTHCLTMPQAVLALAGDGVGSRTALAVAATYVIGFRAAHGLEQLGPLGDADGHTTSDHTGELDVTAIATYAALHDDAHLVKYTMACLLAADGDPAWAPTYLSAAQYLCDWWRAH